MGGCVTGCSRTESQTLPPGVHQETLQLSSSTTGGFKSHDNNNNPDTCNSSVRLLLLFLSSE